MPDEIDRDRTGGKNPPESGEEKDLAATVQDVIDRQEPQTLKNAALAQKAGDIGEKLVDVPVWSKEMATLSEPIMWRPFSRGGNAGLRQAGLDLPEWIEAPDVVDAVKNESFLFARHVNDTVANKTQKAFSEGMRLGESVKDIEKRLIVVYDEWRDSRHAEMVARTETARMFTKGHIEAWRQTGVVELKQWDAASDSCPFCAWMDGRVVGLDENFRNMDDPLTVPFRDGEITLNISYAPIDGPPLHPNCRCAVVPVIQ